MEFLSALPWVLILLIYCHSMTEEGGGWGGEEGVQVLVFTQLSVSKIVTLYLSLNYCHFRLPTNSLFPVIHSTSVNPYISLN